MCAAAGTSCSRYSRTNCVCSLNLVQPVDLVRRVFRLSAAGSYVTVEITATRITCSGPADTHSFSPTFPPLCHCLDLLVCSAPKTQPLSPHSIKRSLLKLSFLLSILIIHHCFLSLCAFFFFISVTLAVYQNSQLCLCISASLCPVLCLLSRTVSALGIVASFIHFPSGLQLRYYKCYCMLALGQISKAINQYSKKIM